jgi:BCD family chlorophyll transporter-like MFS transporter
MRAAPREQIGLSLGAWGAVQATAAGLAIAVGGVIRDLVLAAPSAGATPASPYVPVFALEAALLLLALIVALPLRRGEQAVASGLSGAGGRDDAGPDCGLAAPRP